MSIKRDKRPRAYAITIHCVCGKSYNSDEQGTLHRCAACGHVWNIWPVKKTVEPNTVLRLDWS